MIHHKARQSNGSDENLFFALRAFCDEAHPLAYADITYGCYGVWCGLMHIPSHIIPLKDDFTLDPSDYYGLNETIVIANPNAPTGLALPRSAIEDILKANPDNVVIVDEAYVDFGGELIRDTDCPAVEDYNDFAEALEDIWQKDGMLLTYAAVLDAERPDTLRGACELLQDLDNYQRITEGAYGYGQQRLQETLGLDDEAIYELDGYMDFEQYGQDCMENDCVTKTEFGLLRRLDPPFPEQTQGQQMFQ